MPQPQFNLDDPTQYAGVTYSPPIPTDPGTIQNAIVAQLQAQQPNYPAMAGAEIDGFPDDPESWRAVNQIATVLVRYEGSEYGAIEDVGSVVQERKMKFRVGVLARGLGWSDAAGTAPQGGYALLQACLMALLGFKIPGCAEIFAERDEFVRRDRQGGVWIYALDVIVRSVVVPVPPAPSWSVFTDGIANNQVGASSESVNTGDEP